jgi:CheY-like chemotaxis protein
MLPDGRGLVLVQELRELSKGKGRRPGIIAFSGAYSAGEIEALRSAGVDEVLPKPAGPKQFKDALQRCLARVTLSATAAA